MLKQSVFKTILICGLILFSTIAAKAGIYYYSGARIFGTPAVPAGVNANATAQIPLPYISASFKDYSVTDKITLGVDHNSSTFVPTVGIVAVTLKLEKWDKNSVLITTTQVLELKYQPFPVNGAPYVDKSIFTFNDVYKFKVTIQSITVNGTATTTLPANLYIDADILLERYTTFSTATSPMGSITATPLDLDCNTINDEIQLTWPTINGVEEYQLEWTFVNDYGDFTGYKAANELTYNFKNNNTRITTTATSYKISLTFDHGYLLYRVRGIGREIMDPSKQITGVWSITGGLENNGVVGAYNNRYYNDQAHEANKNWQYSATYAEEGKKKEVINYFDGSLRNRQSVTKINQDKNAIVGETIYDHQGRPAVNVLPVPVKNPGCPVLSESALRFYPLFNKVNSTDAYSRVDFDLNYDASDSCRSVLKGMDISSGASYYYSSNADKTGSQAFVPDAEKFPFSQIEYTPDNTGRIRKQGGVGKEFQLDKTHATQYLYGAPAQRQLDRLFGSEVGNAAHYKKNVVIDPQGQTSVTYLDQAGHTIATALAGNTPTGLQTLPSAANQSSLKVDLFAKDSTGKSSSNTINIQGDGIEFGSQLLVAFPSNYVFNYSIQVDTVGARCLKAGVCFNCVYDLEIKVTDDCGRIVSPTVTGINPIKKNLGKFTTDVSGNLIFSLVYAAPSVYKKTESFTLSLLPGNYTVTKKLTLNKAAKDFYVEKYFETIGGTYTNLNAGCIKTYDTFLQASLNKVDITDCNVTCQACANALLNGLSLSAARDLFVASGKGTEMDFDFLLEECGAPCKETSMCDASYQMMLMDISPDGQYGEFKVSSSGGQPDMNLSIFNTGNMLPKNLGGAKANWHYPKIKVNGILYLAYVDDNGARSRIPVTLTGIGCIVGSNAQYCTPNVEDCSKVYFDNTTKSYYTYPENLKELSDFISFWEDSWAKSLVMYHPEYAYYQSCMEYSIKPTNYTPSPSTSNDFDKLLLSSRTYAQAATIGLISPTYSSSPPTNKILFTVPGNPVTDPFLFGSEFSAYSPDLLAKIAVFRNTMSMIESAAMSARCGTMYGATVNMPSTCKAFGYFPNPNDLKDTVILNSEWNLFKNMYLSEKQKIQRVRDDEYARNNGAYNGCFGNPDFNPFTSGMVTGFPILNSPYFNMNEPCSYSTKVFYRNKKKRFNYSTEQALPSKEENDYLMFKETGQTPMERSMEYFLNKLATDSLLTLMTGSPGIELQRYSEFSKELYMAVNGNNTPLPSTYIPYYWKATSINGNPFTANIILGNGNPKCVITLNRTGSLPVWASVVGIKQLKYTPLTGNFTAVAAVKNNSPASAKPFNYYNITGSTSFTTKLYDSTSVSICNPKQLTKDLANLWSILATGTEISLPNIDLSAQSYSIFLTPAIKATLGTTSNHLIWNYNSSTSKYELYDQTNSTKKLVITFTSGIIDDIYTFANIKNTDSQNAFKVYGLGSTGDVLSIFTGFIELVDGATTTPVNLGDCGSPEPATCRGDEYQTSKDLFNLLKSVMLPKPFNTNADIGASPDFTPLLQSILGVSGQQSTAKHDLIYLNSQNDYKEMITYNLQCKCKIDLWHKGKGDMIVTFNDLFKLKEFVPTGPSDNPNSKYNFYIIADYRYQEDVAYVDTIFGESCFPLKSCDKSHITDTVVSPVISYVNPCSIVSKMNIASVNAQIAFKQYNDSLLTNVGGMYTSRCLRAVDSLNTVYNDKEYHYTLYYYDQAGNLVKTIPPEGVQLVTTPAEFRMINDDRTKNKQTFFTTHGLPTTYTYNSLNQLVRQGMPDQDAMNVWEFGLPNGLDSRLKVTATQFVNSNKGYLTGYIDFTTPTAFKRGYLYTTDDGGVSWTKMNDLVASDLKKVQMVSATVGYAVGTNGIVVKTIDAGNSWDMFPLLVTASLNDLYFTSTLNGVVIGENSIAYKTIDGGANWTAVTTGLPAASSITALTYDGAAFYFTVNTVSAGTQLFKATVTAPTTTAFAIGAWTNTAAIQLGADISKIQLVTTTEGFAIAKDGSLLKTTTAGTVWQLIPTGFSKGFSDIYFETPVSGSVLEGVAIIDSILPGKGIIYKTIDGGLTWTRLSPVDGNYYTAFHFYTNDKGYVVGDKKIKRIVMTGAGNFGLVNIPFSNTDTPNLTTVYFTDADNGWVVNSRKAWFTHNASANAPTWTEFEYGDGATFVIKKLYFGNIENNGLALGVSGEIHKIVQMGNIYELVQLSGPLSSETYVDMDVTTSRVYAFNKIGTTNNLKYLLRSSVGGASGMSNATGGGVGASFTPANVSCMDVQSAGTFLCTGGTTGLLSKASNLTTTATWANLTKTIKPLALYDIEAAGSSNIYAVGKEGIILQTKDAGTNWTILPKTVVNQYNAIKFNKSGTTAITAVKGLIAGENGVLTKTEITAGGIVTTLAIPLNTTVHLNDIALNTADKAYISGNDGTVISIPTIVTPVPVVASTKPALDFKGLCYVPSSNTIITVANNASIYKYNNLTGAKINALYTPGLTGASFANAMDGYIIGEKNTIRYTSNGGVDWNPLTRTLGTAMNAVYSGTPGRAVIVGDNGYIGIATGTTLTPNTTYAGTAALYDVKIGANQTGFIVGNNIALKTTNNGNNWAPVTPALTGTPVFRSLHLFRNNTFIAVGDLGKIYCYNANNAWVILTPASSVNLKRVFFHDDRNGYIIGDAGTIFRCSAPSNIWTVPSVTWTAQVLTGNNGIAAPSTVNLTTIAFANRYQGFIGGALTSGTSPNYARLLTDESNLFSTRFWYDRLGRMVLSQNTKQYNRKTKQAGRSDFSYTLYDDLGRITEVGEKSDTVSTAVLIPFYRVLGDYVNGQFNPLVVNSDSLKKWINTGSARREVTHTYYDAIIPGLSGIVQQNLRKRVASISYEERADANPLTYQHATHYTYDIHGNVKTLWQENKGISTAGQSLKRMDYEYDLISGKVNVVRYQDGQPDAFYHYYNYDSDNRITEVYTSAYPHAGQLINQRVVQDNPLWSKDAKYFYYAHGPLARVEVGENQSQGIDYAYTLQGWIKGVNSNLLNANNDMGNDGLANLNHKDVGRDAFGYTLNYYQGDYKAIDNIKWNAATSRFEAYTAGSDAMAARSDLYSGNISAMVTTLSTPKLYSAGANEVPTILPQATAYKYDQLNRLLDMQAYTNINTTTGNPNYNKWLSGSTYANRYKNTFTYDANGNIISQARYNGAGTLFDNLTYNYPKNGTKLLQNRLQSVTDAVIASPTSQDIENGQAAANYRYDEIGNLMRDAQEEIDTIKWNVYGKIKSIRRLAISTKADLEFKYDASGNRIAKIEKPDGTSKENGGVDQPNSWKTTYYVRDAQGNIMSTYKQTFPGTASFKLMERNLFGSSRLGTENTEIEMILAIPLASPYVHVLGNKRFEGSNHLGNVLSIFTDKKIPRDDDNNGFVDYFQPEVLLSSDYTPFGAPMAERNFNISKEAGVAIYESNFSTINGWVNNWGPTTNSTITTVSSQLKITANVQYAGARYTAVTIPGKQYRYTVEIANITGLGANDLVYFARNTSGPNIVVQTTKQTGVYSLIFTAQETSTQLCVELNTATASTLLTKVKLELLPDLNYRYAFNGKEKDDEVKGSSNSYDYGARIYDSRLGRFLSVDPLVNLYSWQSAYSFVRDNPIFFQDIDGEGDPLAKMQIRDNRASNLQGNVRNNGTRVHQGFDLKAAPGTPVLAVKNAVVFNVVHNEKSDYGKQITLKITDETGVHYAQYSHLSCMNVKKGDEVIEGQVIGETGMTGNAAKLPVSQAHLHFEYRTIASPGKGLKGRENPNEVIDTKFYTQNSQGNQTQSGVYKVDKNDTQTKQDINGKSKVVYTPPTSFEGSLEGVPKKYNSSSNIDN